MKKILIFVATFAFLIAAFPVTCFAADNTTDIVNSVVTTFNTSVNRSITNANVQTIIKDNESDYYYITIGKVNNRDKCEINLYNGHYVINNGGYYYSGDWAGSFWLRYNSSNNSIQVLGNEYKEVLNDEGKHLKWEPYCTGWIGLGSSISLARADGKTDTISFDNFVGKSSLNSYSAASGTEIIFAELPQNFTVVQLGSYYSQSIFNYCFNALNPDYDLAAVSSKLDIIIHNLGELINIDEQLVPLVNGVNSLLTSINDIYDLLCDINLMLQSLYSTLLDALYFETGQNGLEEFVGLKTIFGITTEIRDNLANFFNRFDSYFPANGDIFNGWRNFFSSFKEFSFQDVLLQVQQQIDNAVNPLSEDNKPAFDELTNSFKNDTAYGSFTEISDGISNMFNGITGATPQAVITVETLPVSFFGADIPATKINIDFSWYGKIRNEALYLWRFFLLAGYFFLLFKRAPDIIHGVGLITDLTSQSDITAGSAESITYSTTIDDNGDIINSKERHTYTDDYGNKHSVTFKHDTKGVD